MEDKQNCNISTNLYSLYNLHNRHLYTVYSQMTMISMSCKYKEEVYYTRIRRGCDCVKCMLDVEDI